MDGLSSYRYGDEVRHKEHDIEADWCFRSARRSLLHSLSLCTPLHVCYERACACVRVYVCDGDDKVLQVALRIALLSSRLSE